MKTASIIILTFTIISCAKKDRINHYLNIPVTQKELVKNGFYKYSYNDTVKNMNNLKDSVQPTIKYVIKYDMYSNVKPEINEEGKVYPTQFCNFYKKDSINKKKKNFQYLKKTLHNRIITYLFRKDTLFYKNIIVYSVAKKRKEIADLTSNEKIIKFYDSLNVSIKPISDGITSNKKFTTLFIIDDYKTKIYYSHKNKSYDIFINYIHGDWYSRDVFYVWYSGSIGDIHYYY